MRLAVLSVLVGVALAIPGGAESVTAPPTTFLVRPNLRMCPSPVCGGAWVRRVNHATTRCADGTLARECYVARMSGIPEKLASALAGSVLAQGRLVAARIDGFPGLGALAATSAWRPAGARRPRGTTYRVRDNGVRCVTTPCFSLAARALETNRRMTLSELDLDGVGASPTDDERALRDLGRGGIIVTGRVRAVPDAGPAGAGRALRATQLWLRP
jgi:hypothetical protein